MAKTPPIYYIGIDLGTTNCTMAYSDIEDTSQEISQFSIPQALADASAGAHASLPSFLYFPLTEEIKKKIGSLPWEPSKEYSCGIFARERGSQLSGRMISSAKSWLCHSGIDRRAALLPINSAEGVATMSPLQACSALLLHMRLSWEQSHPDTPFEKQKIFLTVPASFDPSARQLVEEAATLAGFPEVVLLEEPQAAFYAWLERNKAGWRRLLSVDDTILVVDIGGGTTDFSLIAVAQKEGDLVLERRAVGSHLLLGGDNIDLALAYQLRAKFEEQGHQIDDWQMQQLIHNCRKAKELLLSEGAPDQLTVTVIGRSTKLIAGTISTQLTRHELLNIVLEGFAPIVQPEEQSKSQRRLGIQQAGLPYAQDARFSCQLAKFLSMTGESDEPNMERFVMPTAVLFNGGVMHAAPLRQRLVNLLNGWAELLGKPPVKELPEADYDFSVSKGAVYYGMARAGEAIRIRSGTSRSYFIAVEDSAPAVPGVVPPLRAICIAPFGMEEGSEEQLIGKQFALVLGENATFRFFSRATATLSDGTKPLCGTVVNNWREELTELHPIEALLDKGEGDGKSLLVALKTRVTELGVLEVWCLAPDGRKWKLEFDVRDSSS